ncbi:MAG: hypothetical protein GY950_06395 [bacterium]|nr:hypothetical protein [bacterium]
MKKSTIFRFLLGIILAGQVCLNFALDPDKVLTQYMFDVWNKEDGLPILSINAITQNP